MRVDMSHESTSLDWKQVGEIIYSERHGNDFGRSASLFLALFWWWWWRCCSNSHGRDHNIIARASKSSNMHEVDTQFCFLPMRIESIALWTSFWFRCPFFSTRALPTTWAATSSTLALTNFLCAITRGCFSFGRTLEPTIQESWIGFWGRPDQTSGCGWNNPGGNCPHLSDTCKWSRVTLANSANWSKYLCTSGLRRMFLGLAGSNRSGHWPEILAGILEW